MKLKYIILAATTLLASISLATEAILSDDTYASRSRVGIPSASNFGKKPVMAVNANSTGFVKFDLSTLPSDTLWPQIQKATLKLYVGSVKTPGFIGVTNHTTPANWNESTTVPAIPGAHVAIGSTVAISKASAKRYITFDVTEKVRAWIQDPSTNNGLAIYAAAAGLNVQLDTKENVAAGQKAELIIAHRESVVLLKQQAGNNVVFNSGSSGDAVNTWEVATGEDPLNLLNETTGEFTIPVDGLYQISGAVLAYAQPAQPGHERRLQIRHFYSGGQTTESLWFQSMMVAGNQSSHMNGTLLKRLRANDRIRLEGYVTGSVITVTGRDFTIIKVGD